MIAYGIWPVRLDELQRLVDGVHAFGHNWKAVALVVAQARSDEPKTPRNVLQNGAWRTVPAEQKTEILAEKLQVAVNQADMDSAMELVKKRGRGQAQRVPFFLLPKTPNELLMAHPISDHPLLQLRLFAKAQKHH